MGLRAGLEIGVEPPGGRRRRRGRAAGRSGRRRRGPSGRRRAARERSRSGRRMDRPRVGADEVSDHLIPTAEPRPSSSSRVVTRAEPRPGAIVKGWGYLFQSLSGILTLGWSRERAAPSVLPDPSLPPPLAFPAGRPALGPLPPRPGKSPAGRVPSSRSSDRGQEAVRGQPDLQRQRVRPGGAVRAVRDGAEAQIIVDRDTNRSKGFGFVEMDTEAQAQAAIQGLNAREHDGRNLTVNEAKPREARPRRRRRRR